MKRCMKTLALCATVCGFAAVGQASWTYDASTNGNFTAWADAGSRTNDYLSAFPDHWKPIGYMKIHPGNQWASNNIRWMVPRNFGTGMKLLFR